jgi:catechol 2,3-dioxygenase-like lactoylglutathione lyase family enzyme
MAAVRYLVNDVDQSLPFYLALGFTELERWGPPFVMLGLGDLTLWLSGPGTSAARPMADGAQPVPGGWNRLVIEVDDLTALLPTLQAAGATLRNPPTQGPGGTQALLADPSGNLVELFEAGGD